jgi:hypothetical protein
LKKALKSGYVVDRFYKAWHYKNWTVDEDNPFRDYIKALMKLKVENSDFPPGVVSREQKEEFACEYYVEMGINIDIDKVGLNKGEFLFSNLECFQFKFHFQI